MPLSIKECTEADFSDNEEMMEVYELNYEQGLSLYCPDFTDHEDQINLEGTRLSHMSKSIEFQILRCDNYSMSRSSSDPECATPEEIDDYIYGIEVLMKVTNK